MGEKDLFDLISDTNNIKYLFDDIEISFRELIDIFLSDDKFNIFINSKTYKNVEISKICYEFSNTLDDIEYLFYQIPDILKDRLVHFKCYEFVDYQCINTLNKTNNLYKKSDKYIFDSNLKNYILKDMPINYSLVEKAIFIYIKMCDTFDYDDDFYVRRHKLNEENKPLVIEDLNKINLNNNKLVCFEFSELFKNLLSDYKIASLDNQSYGFMDKHDNTTVLIDKYIIRFDSLKDLIDSDFFNVKLRQELNGINVINKNISTKDEFRKILYKVYDDYKNIYSNKKDDYHIKVLSYNDEFIKPGADICFENKIKIFFKLIKNSKLKSFDNIKFIKNIRLRTFNEEEKKNFKITWVGHKNNDKYDIDLIISYYIDNDYFYYCYHDGILKETSYDEIKDELYFDNYVILNERMIPGIGSKGKSYVKRLQKS